MITDISLSGSEIALFGGLLGAVWGFMMLLFRMLMAEKDRNFITMLAEKNRELEALRTQADARYGEMRADRDFFRAANTQQQETVVASVAIIKDGVLAMRALLEDRIRSDRGPR